MSKTCFIIAGPNGAGKTTFAETYLPAEGRCEYFINADLIAYGLSPLHPERAGIEAGRLLFRKMDAYAEKGLTFAVESTLSGMGYVRRINRLKSMGYRIVIYYLRLASPEVAVYRVRQRAAQGGHWVPEADVRRRFHRSWANFQETYRTLADEGIIFDNTGSDRIVLEEW